jgi:uncharacterized membrane protein YphA (DoxX/SURF4 family)
MNITLWIVAGFLAVVFVAGGIGKLVVSKEKVVGLPGAGWVQDFRPETLKALGVLDVLAGIGLVLPAALGIVPVLVPLAATGIVLLMIGAVVVRLRHGGAEAIVFDVTYLGLAAFLAVARFGPESF